MMHEENEKVARARHTNTKEVVASCYIESLETIKVLKSFFNLYTYSTTCD